MCKRVYSCVLGRDNLCGVTLQALPVADLRGVRGVQMHPPLAASNVFLCTYLHESIKGLYSSGMQQQQPGTVTHSRITFLLISRRLSRPRVASRYSVRTSSYFTWPDMGVATQNFRTHFARQ